MPSTISWRGDAQPVAQINTLTIGGTWATNDVAAITCNGKTVSFVVGATTTIAAVCTGLSAAWNAATIPELLELTAAAGATTVTLTADTAGNPFTVTVSKTSASGTISDATTTASAGPNDISTLANYSTGVLPVTGDTLVIENIASSLLYGLNALSGVTLAQLQISASFTGTIGLPRTNGTGNNTYVEYRPLYLAVGATICNIGAGDGNGSQRIKINFGTVQTTCTVYQAASSLERGVPAVLLNGTDASNSLTVLRGTVGVAFFSGEVATLSVLDVGYVTNVNGDAAVTCSAGVTLTTILQAGGILAINSNFTTLNQDAGTVTVGGSATAGTLVIDGTLVDQSIGTFTALTLFGSYDHSKSMTPKTISSMTMYAGAAYHDPFGAVTLSSGIVLLGTTPEKVTLDLQAGKTVSF